jgi:hypothetical protein
LSNISSPFCSGCFRDGLLYTICLGWPQTAIFPIPASQVARITSVSQWSLAGKSKVSKSSFQRYFFFFETGSHYVA